MLKFDYSKMRDAELQERTPCKNDSSFSEDVAEKTENAPCNASVLDLVIPVCVLISTFFVSMLYAGGFFGKTKWSDGSNAGMLIDSLGATDAFIALPLASFVTLIFTFIYFSARRTVSFKSLMTSIPNGFKVMVPSILILTLASTLKTVNGALGTAQFVNGIMVGASSWLYNLLPAVIFVFSALLAFATGTSWGTFGILIPVVTAVFPPGNPLLVIGIAACLSGAVCGDHCSPISDTTIMASTGADIGLIEHVKTQTPYVITVFAVSFVSYIVAGFVQNSVVSLLVGAVMIVLALFFIRAKVQKKFCHD